MSYEEFKDLPGRALGRREGGKITRYAVMESFHCVTPLAAARFPLPRSKKRRIRKKWLRRPGFLAQQPDPCLFVMHAPRCIIGHPATLRSLFEKVKQGAGLADVRVKL